MRHEVNVFVFRVDSRGVEYLLLQPRPRHEAVWRPVVHPVRLDEDLRRAALRAVRDETGIDHPFDLVPSDAGLMQVIGDLQLIGWPFGFQVRNPNVEVRRRRTVAGATWRSFDEALRIMASEAHRQNLLQLHWKLVA